MVSNTLPLPFFVNARAAETPPDRDYLTAP